jgi:putative SOS response-associated peptidase YedK
LCNLYSVTKGQQAIRELARAMRDRTGNLPPLYGIFPDYSAPIVRNQPEGREMRMARWGMPSPVFALKGKNSDPGVTNIRNVKSPHWRRWLEIENRCVVAWTSFSENDVLPDGSRPTVWFAFDETRPLAFFAGIRSMELGRERSSISPIAVLGPRAAVSLTFCTPWGRTGSRATCRPWRAGLKERSHQPFRRSFLCRIWSCRPITMSGQAMC